MRTIHRAWLSLGTVAAGAMVAGLAACVVALGVGGIGEAAAGPAWAPPSDLGILAPLIGSLVVAGGALIAGGGAAYLAATVLSCDRPRARPFLLGLFAAGAWMPTVVLGLFGVVWLQPVIGGYGILPVVIVLGLAAFWPASGAFTGLLDRLPQAVLEGAAALGAHEATARHLLAPAAARPRLVQATLALSGRLVGEGTVTALLIGNNGLFPPGLLHPSATLASVLLTEGAGAPPGSPWESALWTFALALAALSALLGRAFRQWQD